MAATLGPGGPLMHATPGTAGALPAIISGLRGRGYSIVTVPELFRAAGCR